MNPSFRPSFRFRVPDQPLTSSSVIPLAAHLTTNQSDGMRLRHAACLYCNEPSVFSSNPENSQKPPSAVCAHTLNGNLDSLLGGGLCITTDTNTMWHAGAFEISRFHAVYGLPRSLGAAGTSIMIMAAGGWFIIIVIERVSCEFHRTPHKLLAFFRAWAYPMSISIFLERRWLQRVDARGSETAVCSFYNYLLQVSRGAMGWGRGLDVQTSCRIEASDNTNSTPMASSHSSQAVSGA